MRALGSGPSERSGHMIALIFGRRVLRRFSQERVAILAGSLAFTTLLTLVPLAILVFGVAARFDGIGEWILQARGMIVGSFVPGVGDTVDLQLTTFINNAASLPTFLLPALGVSVFLLLLEIETSFNAIWRTDRHWPWSVRFLAFVATVVALPLLAAASGWAVGTRFLGSDAPWVAALRHGVTPLIGFTAFFFMFTVFPARRVHWGASAVGASVAALALTVAKWIFVWYIAATPIQNMIYGALAALPLLQIWVFILWVLILFGGTVAAEAQDWLEARSQQIVEGG
jgi:membrane protein